MDTSEGWKVVIISVQAELAYICRDQKIIMPRLICIYLQLRVYCNLFVHRSNLPSNEMRVRQPTEHFSFTPGSKLECLEFQGNTGRVATLKIRVLNFA